MMRETIYIKDSKAFFNAIEKAVSNLTQEEIKELARKYPNDVYIIDNSKLNL